MGRTRDFLEHSYGRLETIPDEAVLAPPSTRAQWDYLLGQGPEYAAVAGGETAVSSLTTGPLLTSSWDQGVPFNDLCPIGDGGRTVVGCVATAAAQIMKFWNYPDVGIGSKTYTWDGDQSCGHSVGGGSLSATFSDSYDWGNMIDDVDGGYTPSQSAAMSELSYEVGVAFSMDYGRCGSGAYTADGVTVFPTYFNYASTTSQKLRGSYTAANWFKEIRKELDGPLPRPAQYRIPGHSIVCDGYQELAASNLIHLNYGWDDSHTAWYTVDSLYYPNPGSPTTDEWMVAGIQPMNRPYISFIAPDKTLRYGYWNHAGDFFTAFDLPGGGSLLPCSSDGGFPEPGVSGGEGKRQREHLHQIPDGQARLRILKLDASTRDRRHLTGAGRV